MSAMRQKNLLICSVGSNVKQLNRSSRPSAVVLENVKQLNRSSRPSAVVLESTNAMSGYFQPRQYFNSNIISGAKALASAAKREASMTLGMMQSDIPVTIVLGTVCSIAFGAARTSALSVGEWISLVLKSFSWFFGYGYFFDIGNQIAGVEEDKLNLDGLTHKANRPLATGAMSLRGGMVRQVLSGIYYMAVSQWMGGVQLSLCALLWIMSSLLYNYQGWGDFFLTKNYVIMSTGSIALLLGARALAGEVLASKIPPILAAVWIGLCMGCQDFRDEAGDRISGRRTTAVLLGLENARKAWVGMVARACGGIGYMLRNCLSWPDAIIASGAIALTARTLVGNKNKTVKDDHKTYNGICLLGALFFMRSPFWAQLL